MSRAFVASFGAFLLWSSLPAAADSIELREIRELRQIVEQQSKQIEALAQQITKLHATVEQRKAVSPTAPAPTAGASEHAANPATPAPAPAAPPAGTPNVPSTEAPRAEAVPKHTVAKGETLTSIAKLYNITVTELQKLNKIENDRKLQIGQTLTIPSPKPAETGTEKKENP